MLVGEHAFVMLLGRGRFGEIAKLPIADPTRHTLALYCYSRSFFDLDGDGWQVMWMDPTAAEQDPEALAASMPDAAATT
jgi:hypothetical protein